MASLSTPTPSSIKETYLKCLKSFTLASKNSISNLCFINNGKTAIYVGYPTPTSKHKTLLKFDFLSQNFKPEKLYDQDFEVQKISQLSKQEKLVQERSRNFSSPASISTFDVSGNQISFRCGPNYFVSQLSNISKVDCFSVNSPIFPQLDSTNKLLSYVKGNNVYLSYLGTESIYQITKVQENGPVTMGVASYIVQEEFDRYSGLIWNPVSSIDDSGNSIQYLLIERVDDSQVEEFNLIDESGSIEKTRYPKVGGTNSSIDFILAKIVLSSATGSSSETQISHSLFSFSSSIQKVYSWCEYIPRYGWLLDGKTLYFVLLDRLQQRCEIILVHIDCFLTKTTFKATTIYKEKTKLFHNIASQYHVTDNKLIFTFENNLGFRNFVQVSKSLADEETWETTYPLPQFKGIVCNSSKWFISGDTCVFLGTLLTNPLEKHIFLGNLKSGTTRCLTKVGKSYSFYCGHHLGNNLKIAISSSSFSDLSTTTIFNLNTQNGILTLLQEITPHFKDLHSIQAISGINISIPSPFSFVGPSYSSSYHVPDHKVAIPVPSEIADYNKSIYGMVFKPCNFDPTKKYPVYVYVYGGPHVQLVTNSFSSTFSTRYSFYNQILNSFVIVIDSRGSSNRGLHFEAHLYKRMGQVEISDQIAGIQKALTLYPQMNSSKISISGYSYGGYLSLMAMGQAEDFFQCAIAGSSVVEWEDYDTGYTERYMQTKELNPEGYEAANVISYATNFPSWEDETSVQPSHVMISHGLLDENVHAATTMRLVHALSELNKPFHILVYPYERHGIRTMDIRLAYETRKIFFLFENYYN